MEYPLSIWWWGMFCPLQGYLFDRVFSSQIAHSVSKAVRGCTDATPPLLRAHNGTQGQIESELTYAVFPLEGGPLLCLLHRTF